MTARKIILQWGKITIKSKENAKVTKIFATCKPKGQFLINKSVEDIINPEEGNITQTWTKEMNRLFSEEES